MGQWMGILGFKDFKEYLLLNKEINCASWQDLKALCEAGIKANIMCGVFIRVRNPNTPDLKSPKVTTGWMNKICECFTHYIIHHTIDSINYTGNKLFGMWPYTEHILKLKMYDWELGNLCWFAKDLVKENPIASTDTCKVSSVFFLTMFNMVFPDGHPRTQLGTSCICQICWYAHGEMAIPDSQTLHGLCWNMITLLHIRTFILNFDVPCYTLHSTQKMVATGWNWSWWNYGKIH